MIWGGRQQDSGKKKYTPPQNVSLVQKYPGHFREQSRKKTRKAWDRCPLSLGGKFGKCNLVNDSLGIVAWFCCPNSLGRISPGKMDQGNPYKEFGETKPKSLGKDPEGIVNVDLSYVSPNFRFVIRDCALNLTDTSAPKYFLIFYSKPSFSFLERNFIEIRK